MPASDNFRPTPAALIARIAAQVVLLQTALTVDDQIKALFLCWSLLKDAEKKLPEVNEEIKP